MLKPARNVTGQPVVIDDEGHTLGGGEWGAVDPEAYRIQVLVDTGDLVVRDGLPKGADPAVRDAVNAAMARGDHGTSDATPAGDATAEPAADVEPESATSKPRSSR